MIISVSLADFYYWKDSFDADAQLEYLDMVKGFDIDGVELHFTQDEILSGEYKKYVGKLDNLVVTVHLPNHFDAPGIEPILKNMQKILDVKHFIIHSDMFAILEQIPDIPIVVENSDIRKPSHQDMKEVIKLHDSICLDINHIEEAFPGKFLEQFEHVKDNIKELHISALTNQLQDIYPYDDCPHWPIVGSGYTLPDVLPTDAIWVIEGIIPKDQPEILEAEIALLRNI